MVNRIRVFLSFLLLSVQPAFSQHYTKNLESDLVSLTKTYGYLRYFYAGDEAAEMDWERLAYYAADKMIRSRKPLAANLRELFIPLAPALELSSGVKQAPSIQASVGNAAKLLPVFWQHLGDGRGSVGYPYKSMRVNRPGSVLPQSQNDFSGLRKLLDATALKGQEIRISAEFRGDIFYNGQPYIALNVTETGKPGIDISTRGQRVFSGKWNQHFIEGTIPAKTEKVLLTVINIGMAGTADMDKIRVDIKENGIWKNYLSEDFGETDINLLRERWSPFGVNQEISVVHDSLNAFVRISRTKGTLQPLEPLFAKQPAAHEYVTKKISTHLWLRFPLILMASPEKTYPVCNQLLLQGLKKELNMLTPEEMSCDKLATRIANIMILWTKIQHFYPEFDHLKIDWEHALKKAIRASFTDSSARMHRTTLTKMVDPLKDSHMTFYFTSTNEPLYYPPFQWEWIENKLVVTAAFAGSGLNRGDIVIKVNEEDAEVYWGRIKSHVLGVTDSRKNFKAIDESLLAEKNSQLRLTLKKKNSELYVATLTHELADFDYQRKLTAFQQQPVYKEVAPGIFYINLNKISWADLQAHIPDLDTARGIIFDIRAYPSWGTHHIVSHLTHTPVEWTMAGIPMVIYPDQVQLTIQKDSVEKLEPVLPYLTAKRVFLTGGGAISYAEDFIGMVDRYQLGDIVGEPTAGTTGGINICPLLGGMYTPWTGKKIFRPDGSSFNASIGILPTHRVSRTIEGVQAGEDQILRYTLQHIFKVTQ